MTFRTAISLTLTGFLFWCCFSGQDSSRNKDNSPSLKSRVKTFSYGGYSDTVYALIYGHVYMFDKSSNSTDSLQPITDVMVKVEQNGKTVTTDTSGHFLIGLQKGTYNILITKDSFQPLRITNYVSDPDQVSDLDVILEKGEALQTFQIPNWTRQ